MSAKEERAAHFSSAATSGAAARSALAQQPQQRSQGGPARRIGKSSLLSHRRPPICAGWGGGAGGAGGSCDGAAGGGAVAIDMSLLLDEQNKGHPSAQQQQFWTPRSCKHRQAEMSQMASTLAEVRRALPLSLSARARAVVSLRAAKCAELRAPRAQVGEMYQRFSAFVAQQGETIQRIDANSARPVMQPGCPRRKLRRPPRVPRRGSGGGSGQRAGGAHADPEILQVGALQPRADTQDLWGGLFPRRSIWHDRAALTDACFALAPSRTAPYAMIGSAPGGRPAAVPRRHPPARPPGRRAPAPPAARST